MPVIPSRADGEGPHERLDAVALHHRGYVRLRELVPM